MDAKFTKEVVDWLNEDEAKRDYDKGAIYLLKLSGNQIMYRNISCNAKKNADFIVYNINKYIKFRVEDLTHEEVSLMQKKVDVIVKEHFSLAENNPSKEFKKGKRADHEQLPLEIQSLYVENLGIVQKMRELHVRLSMLSDANVTCPDSERYPFLKELIAFDKRLKRNWETYDKFIIGNEIPIPTDDILESKRALRLVNLNKGKYAKNQSEELKVKIQEWYAKVLKPSDKLVKELTDIGII